MTRRKTDEPATENGASVPPPDPLIFIVNEWLYEPAGPVALERILAELHAAGLHTVEQLAAAPIGVVSQALRAAYQADAHKLTGIAARWREHQQDQE